VPPGAYAVGVSGGVDSVALLLLLRRRSDLSLEVVHLNHETRGPASDADAKFVFDLSLRVRVPCLTGHWHGTEPMLVDPPKNQSARFRAGRMALFRHVVKTDGLDGVILAHHADDVAETVLQRLLRGGGVSGLASLRTRATIGGLPVLRPLLNVRRETLRQFLVEENQPWREDESNASPRYQRNRVRKLLSTRPELTDALLELGNAAAAVKDWARRTAPAAPAKLPVAMLRGLPAPLARETARRWLAERGAPPGGLTAPVLRRLIEMSEDAASAPRQHFPGGVLVRRRGGEMFVE
jgi:tRNA(Ile)-lysidine synthase